MTLAEDAFSLLASRSAIDRLKGARLLFRAALSDADVLSVEHARTLEQDSWVRAALERVLDRGPSTVRPRTESIVQPYEPSDPNDVEDIRAQLIATVTQMLLHEVRPLVGGLEYAASKEVKSFDTSETAKRIQRLKGFLETVSRFEKAAHPPRNKEFDLTDAVVQAVTSENSTQSVQLGREDPVPTRGDWDLIELGFVNGMRNALEACEETQGAVVVNWGVTDRDAWVAVLDEGCGLPSGYEDAHEPGRTTKSKTLHHGWGLTIAHRAIASAGGTIALRPRSPRGTSFEIRWPTVEQP